MRKIMTILSAVVLCTGLQAYAATITQTVGNIDWNADIWGTSAAAPTTGNDYVTATGVSGDRIRIGADGNSSTFGGDSLTVVSGTRALVKLTDGTTATVNGDLVLDGGWLSLAPNSGGSATLAVTQLRVDSASEIGIAQSAQTLVIDGILTGSGNITLTYDDGTAGGGRKVLFNSISGYTGAIDVTEGMAIEFGVDYVFANSLNLGAGSVFTVAHTFTFDAGNLTIDGVAIAGGTYTGGSLSDLGANFDDAGGTLIVTGSDGIPPAVPVNLAATAVGLRIDLSWDANTSDTNFSSYVLYRGTTNGGPYEMLSNGLTTNVYSDLDLPPSTTFHYVVTAVDDEGDESAYSEQASATTDSDTVGPEVPTRIFAIEDSVTSDITVSWNDSVDSQGDLFAYNIYRSETEDGTYSLVGSVDSTTTSYVETPPVASRIYYYKVAPEDSLGNETLSDAVASLSLLLEAEDADLSGAVVATITPGFTGTGFADYNSTPLEGTYIEWTVNAEAAGNQDLYFRYAFGGSPVRPLAIEVNGTVLTTNDFPNTGSWSTWGYSDPINANLNAGDNVIRLATTGASGPNVDHLYIPGLGSVEHAEPFEIEISSDGSTLTITLPGQNGIEYYIDYREDLVVDDWTLYSTHAGTGSPLEVEIDISGENKRFYRARAQ